MWRRYPGEFFDVSLCLWCVGKPLSIAFQRPHSRQDPPSRCAAIAPIAPWSRRALLPAISPRVHDSLVRVRAPSILLVKGFPTSPHTPESAHSLVVNRVFLDPLLLIIPIHLHPPYLLDPWTVSGRSGLVPIASTSSMSLSHRLGTTSRCVLHKLRPVLPSLSRLAEAFSCFLLAPAAQEFPDLRHLLGVPPSTPPHPILLRHHNPGVADALKSLLLGTGPCREALRRCTFRCYEPPWSAMSALG